MCHSQTLETLIFPVLQRLSVLPHFNERLVCHEVEKIIVLKEKRMAVNSADKLPAGKAQRGPHVLSFPRPTWSYGQVLIDSKLKASGYQIVSPDELDKDPDLLHQIEGVTAFWRVSSSINKLVPVLPRLKTISCQSAGLEGFDLEAMARRGISIGSPSLALCEPVADMALTLLLAAARRLKEAIAISQRGGSFVDMSCGSVLTRATVGIVGMGNIGFEIAKRTRGFDMKVLYHNRNRRSAEEEQPVSATYYAKLHDMLPLCDYVVISCPLSPETRHIITMGEFRLMKKTAIIVNIARGALIDHKDLQVALESGEIGGAGLDATDPEPLPEGHPLLHMNNVIVTPHNAAKLEETAAEIAETVVENLRRGLNGEPLLCGTYLGGEGRIETRNEKHIK